MHYRVCGSPGYMAPEVGRASVYQQHGSRVDIWSLGIILYMALTAQSLFDEDEVGVPLQRHVELGADASLSILSPHGHDALQSCLQLQAILRTTASTLLHHVWLRR